MRRQFSARIALASLMSLAPSLSLAAEPFTVTTGDFVSQAVELRRVDSRTITGKSADGQEYSSPMSGLIQIARPVRAEARRGLILCVNGGERLIGKPVRINGANLVWSAANLGEISVPIEQVMGILRDATEVPGLDERRGEDEMRLANGDIVKGIVTAVTSGSVSITPTGATAAVEVPADSIRTLLMASPPQGRSKPAQAGLMVRLTSGAVFACSQMTYANGKFAFKLASGTESRVPENDVVSVENTAGPVVWLSTRTPSGTSYTPFFNASFPPQMDRTVLGEPLRAGNVVIQRGIGMHSRTRMTFSIGPDDTAFRTRYAVDPSLGYADMDVRVLVDDRVVHEQKGVRGGTVSEVIKADLAGAKSLTLEVDFGKGYDVQDHLNWLEPAIIRAR